MPPCLLFAAAAGLPVTAGGILRHCNTGLLSCPSPVSSSHALSGWVGGEEDDVQEGVNAD